MSENVADLNSAALEDADLKNALLAAFGSDALDLLEDEEVAEEAVSLTAKTDGDDHEFARKIAELTAQLHRKDDAALAVDASDIDLIDATTARYIVFEVASQRFGVPLESVEQIDRLGKVTVLPRAPNWLRGIANLRGKIFSVTDFRKLLRLDDESHFISEKIIVIQSERLEICTALVVDRVLGIRNLDTIPESAQMLSGPLATFACGISSPCTDSIVLLQPDLLLGCNDLQSFSDS